MARGPAPASASDDLVAPDSPRAAVAEYLELGRAGPLGLLRAHPLIWPDAVVVRFKEFGPSPLDIEVMAWFLTFRWAEFQLIRQEVLLQFMEVVEGAGTSFAFPTRTVHVVGEPRPELAAALP